MDYTEYEDQAAEFMRLAVPLMQKHGIAMTPANYAVWFEYVSGSNVALVDALDKEIEEKGRLTDQQSRQLYERFFDREKDQQSFLELREELSRLLREVISFVYTGVVSTDKSNTQLQHLLGRMSPNMTGQEVHDLVEEVLASTRQAVSSGEVLSERLNYAMEEVQTLKKELGETRREAKSDMLTGLANRKAFDEVLVSSTRDADQNHQAVTLIFCNLDNFHDINENHGHPVGDLVLKRVASLLHDHVSSSDLVARYSGEEFAILLNNQPLSEARKVAEKIRTEMAAKRINRKDTGESLGQITLSLGLASYVATEGVDSFMQRADRALYMAKRRGRNCVSEAPPPII